MRLLAEVDLKCKKARFFKHSRHLASCYPDKSYSTMKTNVHRYLNGDIKSFNDHHYFWMDIEGVALEEKTVGSLQQEALDIARAQLKKD